MLSQRACVWTIFFSPQLSLLAKLSRRAVLCCALVIALVCPQQAIAADYSTPDYYVSADVTPYYATTAVTIAFSASNLSDVTSPATTVAFSMAPVSNLSQVTTLGQASVPVLGRWAYVTQTVTFPLPAGLFAGTTEMRLTANINPTRGNGEVKTANNITTSGFGIQIATSPSFPDLTITTFGAPTSALAGSTISLTDTTKNAGTASAGSFTVAYTLTIGSSMISLGSRTVSSLPVGGSSLGGVNAVIPASLASGTYTLTVRTNATNSVTETNSLNNTTTRTLTVTAPLTSSTSTTSTSTTSTSTTGTFLTDTTSHAVPTLSRPALHAPLIDPTFGATITRITDPSMAPASASSSPFGLVHEYARYPAISADNKKMVLQVLGGADAGFYGVRDLVSGALLYKIAPQGDPELSWHPTDSTRLFYRYANEIRVFHTDTGQAETLMAFPQYYTIGTNEEGRPSDDWRYYAFLGYRSSSSSTADIVVVDLVTKQVIATWSNAGAPDWVSMSPSGNSVVVMWTNGLGTRLYSRTLSYVRTLFSDYAHSDFALDANNNEVLVYQATETAQINELSCPNPPNGSPIASVRLLDGQKKILLGDCNKADWTPVITGAFLGWNWFTPHFSGIASRQHLGWILISTYTDPLTAQKPFAREVFWLKLDGSGQVRRVAHHHSDQSVDTNGNKDYWAEPHATGSWDGRLILFASVWGQPFREYDLYTVTGQWW